MELATEYAETSVGVRLLDCDHRQLTDAINELQAAVLGNQDRTRNGELLRKLADFTLTHFALEEGMMAATRYPGTARHRLHHQHMLEQWESVLNDCREGTVTLDGQSLSFLNDWHTDHIQEDDLKYGLWLNMHGVR
jgi:hemerythrin